MLARRLRSAAIAAGLLLVLLPACSHGPDPIRVGTVYPISGAQGPGGLSEYRGVRVAADLANQSGGVNGHPIQIVPIDTPAADAAEGAIKTLKADGVSLVLGSYGSTISDPAAYEASENGMLFWETGAVGEMQSLDSWAHPQDPQQSVPYVFRVAPTGETLGAAAIDFVTQELAPRKKLDPSKLRVAVVNVNDQYGSSVAAGAVARVKSLGMPLTGQFPYDPRTVDAAALMHRVAATNPDVLFVSAYLDDGVAIWQQAVKQQLPVKISIGTSSSYCLPQFGQALGSSAVGLFASDKPSAPGINATGLSPVAAALLKQAQAKYTQLYNGAPMDAPALAGFSGAWALFHDTMPHATAMTPAAVAAAARDVQLPSGSLPNGSGLEFAGPSAPDPGANLRAASVIWEWVGLNREAIVWPPGLATHSIEKLPLAS
jgi:branched-chain amino acid transport system substrate-binding protein